MPPVVDSGGLLRHSFCQQGSIFVGSQLEVGNGNLDLLKSILTLEEWLFNDLVLLFN